MAKPKKNEILPLTIFSALFWSFLLPFLSQAENTIRPKDTLTGNQTLVSASGVFELGFFSDGFSGSYYLGIWFVADQMKKPVWVANRESPLIDPYGDLQIRPDGNLILIDRRQTPFIINSDRLASTTNTSATLFDTGNFVLFTERNSQVWQSFDYPTDTFLPGMKIGWFGLNSGDPRYRVLVSWVSKESVARGAFTLGVNNSSLNTLTVWRGDSVHMDIGFWEGGKFRFIFENSSGNYNFSFFTNNEETYFSFSSTTSLSNNYKHVSKWFVMDSNGNLDEFSMSPEGKIITSVSHVLCEDSAGGNTGKCLIKIPFKCKDGDNFSVINGTMPTSLFLRGSINLGFSECQLLCRSNCSCSAFASLQDDQTGCQLYFGSKNDIFKVVEKGSGIVYVRGHAPRQSDGENKWKLWLAIIALLASLWVLSLILIGLCHHRRRRKRDHQVQSQAHINRNEEVRLFRMGSIINRSSNNNHDEARVSTKLELGGRQQDQELPLFSIYSIVNATNSFAAANKLGEGGFGTVYKGRLPGGQEIAVKRLSKISRQGMEEFINEVTLISKLQHRNLARLLGCCIEAEESILIYEYMPNKSLDSFIFDSSRGVLLDWRKRISIIEGIAQGLLYLHKYSRLRIIHRDLKASNILLDKNMDPKISDFGMARIFGDHDTRVKTKRVVGTYGYMSPEYAMDGLFSEKSDVFSFGVILLEIISGNKNIAFFETDKSLNLLGKAWNLWKEGKCMELIDPTLRGCGPKGEEVMRCVQLGLLCVQETAFDRPTISDVVFMLSHQTMALPPPREPAFLSQLNSGAVAESSSSRQRLYSNNDITISEVHPR